MNLPTITLVKSRSWTDTAGYTRTHEEFLVSGGDITPEWLKHTNARDGIIECRVTVWRGGEHSWERVPRANGGGVYLSSFGGHVWPSAWPELFESGRLLGNNSTRLTPLAEALFDAARSSSRCASLSSGTPASQAG